MSALPAAARALLQEAARALRTGAPAAAERLLARAQALCADAPEVLVLQASLLLHRRQPAHARAVLEAGLARHPGHAALRCEYGNLLNACGEGEAALAAWEAACALDPQLAVAWYNRGRNHQLRGETAAAIATLERACALAPQALPPRVLLADALLHAGRLDDAEREYRAALAVDPACGDAWRGLSNLKTRPLGAADAAALQAQLARRDLPAPDRIAMLFALGRLEEDRGQPRAALDAFTAANALQKRLTPWSAEAFRTYVQQALAATATLPAPVDPRLGEEVIFIVGLPRSGSTLFEQILAAHPQVEGASELPDLGIVLQQESRRRGQPYPQWVAQASAEDWHRLGRDYLARTARWRRRRPRQTDKQPDNWKHAGILRAMLPGATIIETRRDPLETAWSCFKQPFYSQPHFANDMADIALYMQGCAHAMQQWRARDPARIHLHVYEDLLAAPEARIRALLDDCGLPFDPACLAFHRAERSVRTASAAQVRQPLRADTARALAYGSLLQPLLDLLALPWPF
ncbi:tetratricopeptide repeat-containing sulfotransferase family protein [Thermomonas flagellata]|uniref:tetratricopeptide repeat-containing sulfotransferase family protein n=1 Tax=Thermomonas flagellata TaxID=2888524 RepID=UPI001F04E7B4|nr:sulfotransferase [Thermomonas flagellata]